MIKFCKTCNSNSYIGNLGVCGYYWSYIDTATKCDKCGSEFQNIDFPSLDLKVLIQVSQDVKFIEAMIKLRQDNIIEYESRMSQFRTQVQQQEQIEQQKQDSSKPHCPQCHSTDISRIGTGERIGSIVMWGLFSKKINKSFKCKSCGYTW